MTNREMGIEEARKSLGDLVLDAQRDGIATRITRKGKPAAILMPTGVNMYLLQRIGDIGYDEADGFVVAAKTDDDARQQAAERAGDEGGGTWLAPSLSTCEVIGSGQQSGVFLRSFRAG